MAFSTILEIMFVVDGVRIKAAADEAEFERKRVPVSR
jgi:hypothetical protein